MQTLIFSGWRLNGTIPSSINALSRLQFVFWERNALVGTLPSLRNLTQLQYVNLEGNALSGDIRDSAPQNTFVASVGATSYEACPFDREQNWLSFSSAGSLSVFNCSCAHGSYARVIDGADTFVCLPCPSGALCIGASSVGTGTAPPLALEGFWHEPGVPDVMYVCEEGFCLAEQESAAVLLDEEAPPPQPAGATEEVPPLNCREGHTGIVCGTCIPGWRFQDGFCAPCDPESSVSAWRQDRRSALAAMLALLFVIVSLPILLAPLFPDWGGAVWALFWRTSSLVLATRVPSGAGDVGSELDASAHQGSTWVASHTAHSASRLDYIFAFLRYMAEPLFILIECLQIVSSFSHTTHAPWPQLFRSSLGRLSTLNANFIRLPKVACLSPTSNIYDELNGVTLSVTAILAYMAAVWACGTAWASTRRLPNALRSSFNRRMVARAMLLLRLAYAPVSEVVLSIFSCRKIGDAHYLTAETEVPCFTAEHNKYRAVAAFWIVVYVAGTPALILGLLLYYRIHEAARRVRKTAMLHQLINLAAQRNIEQPVCNTATVTPTNIGAEHVDALFYGLLRRRRLGAAPDAHGGDDGDGGAVKLRSDSLHDLALEPTEDDTEARLDALRGAAGAAPTAMASAGRQLSRDQKLRMLLHWGKKTLSASHYTWRELAAAEDPRRPGAEEAIGELFEHMLPVRWWWKLWETTVKVVLTGLLLFVQPGSAAQIVAGLFLSLAFLLFYLKMLPYASKPVRQVAYCCSLIIFVFFIYALLLKMDVRISSSETTTSAFYTGGTAVLLYGLLAAPMLIMLNNGFTDVHVGGHGASPRADIATADTVEELAEGRDTGSAPSLSTHRLP